MTMGKTLISKLTIKASFPSCMTRLGVAERLDNAQITGKTETRLFLNGNDRIF